MTPADKLAALPKAALVEVAIRLGIERNAARAEAEHATAAARRWRTKLIRAGGDYRYWGPEQVRDIAQAILDDLPADPDAENHLDQLLTEVAAHDARVRARVDVTPRRLPSGPRCHRGTKGPCMRLLTEDGLCTRHDAKKIRNARKAAA